MKWQFTITEITNGAYELTAMRNSGNIISFQSSENKLYKIFQQAFVMEVDLGTLPSKALFNIVSCAKQTWSNEYHDKSFGSWVVKKSEKKERFVYDGKDFLLKIYETKEKLKWQGVVKEKEDIPDYVFQFLVD